MYVVIPQEMHPHGFIKYEVFGPFESVKEAFVFAETKYESEENKIKDRFGGKHNNYLIRKLKTP